jgi:IS5 family transposase
MTRNLNALNAFAADNGYDWEEIRTRLRAERITPLITR